MKHFRDLIETLGEERKRDQGRFLHFPPTLASTPEEYANSSVCHLLSAADPPSVDLILKLRSLSLAGAKKGSVGEFMLSAQDWKGENSEDSSRVLISAMKCPKIAGWARYSGKVYRGLAHRKPFELNKQIRYSQRMEIRKRYGTGTDAIARLPVRSFGNTRLLPFVQFDMTYESKLTAQSWSRRIETAWEFAAADDPSVNTGVIVEYDIPVHESLNLLYLSTMSFYGGKDSEQEVVRLSNTPIKVRATVPLTPNEGNKKFFNKLFEIERIP